MKVFSVTFDDSNVVVVEPGLEIVDRDGVLCIDLGTDVGGATLAMVPYIIDLDGDFGHGADRVRSADVHISETGQVTFRPSTSDDGRAFVVLSVIQRSPDARTELEPYPEGVACVGNAFDRPMDTQVLVLASGSQVRFRRFQRGGNYGPWQVLAWDGVSLEAHQAAATE